MTAVKIITVMGTSTESWEDAAMEAVSKAHETIEDIKGVEVMEWTATVENGSLSEYKTTVNIAFPVHTTQT